MNTQTRKFKSAAGLLAVALLAAGSITSVSAQSLPDRIKLGQLLSMTGAGASGAASFGVGARIAVADINKAGGILGKPIDIVAADDQTDATVAVNEARRLINQEKVNVMIGPAISLLATAVMPMATQAKVVQMTSAGVTQLGGKVQPYFFSMNFDSQSAAGVLVDYTVNNMKAKTVAWLGDSGPQGKLVLETVKPILAAKGVKLVAVQEFNQGATDVTPQLLTLRKEQPEVIYLWTIAGQDTGYVINGLSDIGWKVPVLVSQTGTLLPAQIMKVSGPKSFDNMISIGVKAFTACPSDQKGNASLAAFKDKIKAAEPAQFAQISPLVAAWGHDAVQILKAAIEGTRSVDGAQLGPWIEKNTHTVKNLVGGELSTNANSHFMLGASGMTLVANPDRLRPDGLMTRRGC